MQIFNCDNIENFINAVKSELDFPYVNCRVSTLSGIENISLMVTLSEESKEKWPLGILENSSYRHILIENTGAVENFTIGQGLKRIRKFTAKSAEHFAYRVNKSK